MREANRKPVTRTIRRGVTGCVFWKNSYGRECKTFKPVIRARKWIGAKSQGGWL